MIEILSQLISIHGAPRHLRSDNGPEFVAHAVLRWLVAENIDTAHIDPGKPWRNGTNESFNGKFRDKCLSMQWFKNRIDAKILIEDYRCDYNEVRPEIEARDSFPNSHRPVTVRSFCLVNKLCNGVETRLVDGPQAATGCQFDQSPSEGAALSPRKLSLVTH